MTGPLRRPKTFGGVIYLGVIAAALVGLAMVGWFDWRRGITVIGAALVVGAAFRLVLGGYEAGMLRVRENRFIDVALMVAAGVALIALAWSIPNQPGA